MSKRQYYPPLIDSKNFSSDYLKKLFEKIVFSFKHSIFPHEFPKDPEKELPTIEFKAYSNALYDICKKIYDESMDRIDKLENKSFKLLSYIGAFFIFLSFMYSCYKDSTLLKIVLFISIIPLIISIIISLRCISVKVIKNIYNQYI